MKKTLILSLGLFVFIKCIIPAYAGGSKPKCNTKYPVVLVHGAFFKDENILGIDYWWKIPDALEDEGATVYVTQQRTFGSTIDRAMDLRKELAGLFAVNSSWSKINIIGHSQGPLDTRYLISNLDIPGRGAAKNCIASLTSISGVHRGSEVADVIWAAAKGIPVIGPIAEDLLSAAVNAFADIFYYNEEDQDCMDLLLSLTSDYMKDVFNPMTPDVSGVYYQSYAGKIKTLTADFLIAEPLWLIIKLMGGGDNDCLVSVNSAKWGNWKGTLTGAWWCGGVSHFGEINHFFGLTPGFDAPDFYVDVVKDLKSKGL